MMLIGLIAAGCAGPARITDATRPDVPATFPTHSVDDVLFFIGNATQMPESYEARASVRLDSPQQRGTFSSVISQRGADTLYATLSPGLGIEAARALVTVDTFYVHDRIKRKLYLGALKDAGSLFPGAPSLEDIVTNLIGQVKPGDGYSWTLSANQTHYLLNDESGRKTFFIDPTIWRVTAYEERSRDGELIEERLFQSFDMFDGLYIPRRVVLNRPLDDVSVILTYRDFRVNPVGLVFSFRVDPSVERVYVDPTRMDL